MVLLKNQEALPGLGRPEVEFVTLPLHVLAVGERRLEGEAYLTGGYAQRLRIENSGKPFVALGEVANVWQPSRLKGVSVAPEHGIPFLTATQVFDTRPWPRKWLAANRTDELARRFVARGWILVTCSGNVGETIISHAPHDAALVSHDLLRVQVKEDSQRGYTYAFLRSRSARLMMRSSQYGSIIKHLEPEHLQRIPVPLAPRELCEDLARRVTEVFSLRDEAYGLTLEAERLFGEAVGKTPSPNQSEMGFTLQASALFSCRRRLDGFHYNPTAAAVLEALQQSVRQLQPLGSLVERITLPNRFKRGYATVGTPYLDSEDLFKVNPEVVKHIAIRSQRDATGYLVKAGWLLIARSGQLYGINGSVALAGPSHEGKIVSEHLIRVVPKTAGIRTGYLAMALGHRTYGRPLITRWAFGTEVPEIAPDDLQEVPVARLGQQTEDDIASRVEQASGLCLQANRGEDAAVAIVEAFLHDLLG
jgi:hypothetical protein